MLVEPLRVRHSRRSAAAVVVLDVRPDRPVADRLSRDLLPDRVLPDRVADAGGGRGGQRHDRGAVAPDAPDAGGHGPLAHLAGGVPEPRLDARRRRELPAARQRVRDAAAGGVEPAAAVVGGLAVDRRRPRVGGRRRVGRREGVPDRAADVRQAARPEDPRAVGPGRVGPRRRLAARSRNRRSVPPGTAGVSSPQLDDGDGAGAARGSPRPPPWAPAPPAPTVRV